MSTESPNPVEVWAPTFLTFAGSGAPKFDEKWLAKPENVLSTCGNAGTWCKLCDAPVPPVEDVDRHHRKHLRELREWRERTSAEAQQRAREALAATRAERALEREALGIERSIRARSSDLTPERRLRNKITSTRYRLKNPAKFKRASWTVAEVAEMERTMSDAQAELETVK